jgi:hypothetical protein
VRVRHSRSVDGVSLGVVVSALRSERSSLRFMHLDDARIDGWRRVGVRSMPLEPGGFRRLAVADRRSSGRDPAELSVT